MLEIKDYLLAKSLEQAYEYNQKKQNVILGGMGWLKLGHKHVQTAIDLSGIGLDFVEETEDEIQIGCMATLRELELHKGLNELTDGAVANALGHIVGIQFRNCATIGGSIYGRYGFSDILPCFLAYETWVKLYKQGMIPLKQYADMNYDGDIVEKIIVKKTGRSASYQAFRNQSTDLPILTCALALSDETNQKFVPYAVVGARPSRAMIVEDEDDFLKNGKIDAFIERVIQQVPFGTNMRASSEYRSELVKVLLKRNYEQILEKKVRCR